jgi:hypothetical protein
VREYLQFWPLALIAIGVVHLAQARTGSGQVGGAIWILVGVVLLGKRLGFFDVRIWSFWPLILVPCRDPRRRATAADQPRRLRPAHCAAEVVR